MANSTIARGFEPVDKLGGNCVTGAVRSFYVPATYATALYIGDPVRLPATATSNTTKVRGYAPGALPVVELASATSHAPFVGVVVGFEPVQGAESTVYGAASTERIAKVCVDPAQLYRIRDDGAAVLGAASVGLNADFVYAAGSAYTGISGVKLDAGTTTAPAASASYQLTIIAADNRVDNDATLASANWIVRINLHQYNPAVVGY